MTRRRLPIGIQTFRKIREGDYYCVDKTAYIARLVDGAKHYLLSRPRRFGKSLLLDTLKELFEGNEPLFRGLAIHGDWDWSVRHPVLRLRFGGGRFRREDDVPAHVAGQLDALEKRAGIAGTGDLGETLYRLGYPNREVRQGLNERRCPPRSPIHPRQDDV